MVFEARNAHIVGGRLAASRHSSAATARRALCAPSATALLRLLPAAVQNSQVASIIPSEISLPLKTTMSSRMSTICPMTALNPMSVRAARTANVSGLACAIVLDCIGVATRN